MKLAKSYTNKCKIGRQAGYIPLAEAYSHISSQIQPGCFNWWPECSKECFNWYLKKSCLASNTSINHRDWGAAICFHALINLINFLTWQKSTYELRNSWNFQQQYFLTGLKEDQYEINSVMCYQC